MPTLDEPIELEIPAGTQPHDTLTLRGKGMPALRRGRHGDLRVVVNVVIPRRLTDEQRELLERLAGTSPTTTSAPTTASSRSSSARSAA